MAYPVPGYRHLATERPQGSNLDAGQIDLRHLDPKLLALLNTVGAILGKTITIFSAYRSPAYSAKVGGFASDPHTRGVAVDAKIGSTPLGDYPGAMAALGKLGLVSGNQPDFYKGQRDPAHVQLSSGGPATATDGAGRPGGLYGVELVRYIVKRSRQLALDPVAVLVVALKEGGFGGKVGDQGTSFGPFQLHKGGKLPAGVQDPEAWANTPAGVDYALTGIARVARGKRGEAAIYEIVYNYERPRDPATEAINANWLYRPIQALLQKNDYAGIAGHGGAGKSSEGKTAGEGLGDLVPGDPFGAVGDLIGWLLDPNNWLRVLQIIAGAALAFAGLLLLARQVALASGNPDPVQLAAGRAGV